MPGATLYQLTAEFHELRRKLEDSGGELTPELEAAIAANQSALDEKIGNIQRLIVALEDEIKAQKARKDDFERAMKRSKRTIKWLQRYCALEMQGAGLEEIRDPQGWGTYKLRQEKALVVGDDIPDEFYLPGKPRLDRTALQAALEAEIPCGNSKLETTWIVKRYRSRA